MAPDGMYKHIPTQGRWEDVIRTFLADHWLNERDPNARRSRLGNPLPWEQDNSDTLDSRLIENIFRGSAVLIRFANRRQFFSSKERYIGLAPPEAEVGDVVVVFCGATIPFVLH